jgi:SAM-dependent methyltransferase
MGLGIGNFIRFKYWEWTGRFGPKFEGHYTTWRALRIQAILDHYGHRFFENKTILELGAGYGAIGAAFALIGGKVTCAEGRPQNVAEIKRRYPFLEAVQFDLNQDVAALKRGSARWDMVIHMGVLYHLRDPEASLRQTCKICDQMILETECVDSDDPHFSPHAKENTYLYDQALDGVGSRPSPAFVERVLREEGMEFAPITDSRCNSGPDVYDWPVKNSRTYIHGQRRMWFVKRKS